jgi:diguanylate cyclase (GGDEF)-like protein
MQDGAARTRTFRATPVVALVLAIGLLTVAIGSAAGEHGRQRDSLDRALRAEAKEQAAKLDDYFARGRSLTLVAANNPAFRDFYQLPGTRRERILANGPTLTKAQQALAYLERVFPGSIGEACFIDSRGAENARAVRGVVESRENLSPDETAASFFAPTFALKPGEVYQARPYLSPDTSEWVVSNSTPVPGSPGRPAAIIHFEITMESFRKQAADTSDRFDIAIVEANTGKVVADSRFAQAAGEKSRLGLPGDRRFAQFFSVTGRAEREGGAEVGGKPTAFTAIDGAPHNANHWVVVASARTPASGWVDELNGPELGMLALALVLLGFAALSFRASQAELQAAALTDALTGLRNRRSLIADLERGLAQASEADPLLLGLFDLDGFKSYNDTFGHPAGDALLARLAARLDESIRGRGTTYRMGGDEFCLLARSRGNEARELLDAAQVALSEHGEGFTIGASFGAVVMPAEAADATEALHIADQRMYAHKNARGDSAGRQTTDVLMRVLAERHPELHEHLDDVTALCAMVADTLDLPEQEVAPLLQAAALHDVGKAAVPDAILHKPGPLADEEWAFMRQHTLIGERILGVAPSLARAAELVRWTHERFDGAGYPDGLAGDEIPLAARIIAVCDAYDAMTTSRPYRPTPMSPEGALAELRNAAGSQFDPAVVAAFEAALADPGDPEPRGRRGVDVGPELSG